MDPSCQVLLTPMTTPTGRPRVERGRPAPLATVTVEGQSGRPPWIAWDELRETRVMTRTKRSSAQDVAGKVASATVRGTGKIIATAAVATALATAVAMPIARHMNQPQR